GVTLVLTTHYMDEAEQLCDRLVVMDAGKIAAGGSPPELIRQYSTPEVLELRFRPSDHDQAVEKLADFPAERIEVLADRLLLYVADGDAAPAGRAGDPGAAVLAGELPPDLARLDLQQRGQPGALPGCHGPGPRHPGRPARHGPPRRRQLPGLPGPRPAGLDRHADGHGRVDVPGHGR